jgi:hypothetical protein
LDIPGMVKAASQPIGFRVCIAAPATSDIEIIRTADLVIADRGP